MLECYQLIYYFYNPKQVEPMIHSKTVEPMIHSKIVEKEIDPFEFN